MYIFYNLGIRKAWSSSSPHQVFDRKILFFVPANQGNILLSSTKIISHLLCIVYQLIWDPSWGRFTQIIVPLVPNGVMVERMTWEHGRKNDSKAGTKLSKRPKVFQKKTLLIKKTSKMSKGHSGRRHRFLPSSRNPLSLPSQNWSEGLKKCPAAPRSFERQLGGSLSASIAWIPFLYI